MKCARAFGALVLMRDDPMDAQIPEFEPSDYSAKQLESAKARIVELGKMTLAQCEAEADKELSAMVKQRAKSKAESDEKRAAYQAVLIKVEVWTPPTPNHEGLKRFMTEQLTESIKFDCHDENFLDRCYPLTRKSAATWYGEALASAKYDVEYHTDANAKELARTRERNKWVRDLRDSLSK